MRFVIIILLAANLASAQTKYALSCDAELLGASLDSALLQAGVIELSGRNDGEPVKYMRAVGISGEAPYCAAGQYWSFLVAALALDLPVAAIPIKRTAVANAIYSDAAARGAKKAYCAEKHDLIVWRKKRSWRGHIERVVEVLERGWTVTIAFNTREKVGGEYREGVFLKKRNVYHPLGRLAIRGLIGFSEE